jgi:hypothetical protein
MTRTPVAIAGLALAAVTALTAGACGSDSGDGDSTAADTSTPTVSTSPTTSDSPTVSASPTDTPAATDTPSGDPVPSPVVNKAVKAAIAAHFPALIPSGVPAGWTVVSAAYVPQGGGSWQIVLTDPSGAPVQLVQSKATVAELVSQSLGADAQPAGKIDLSDYGTGNWSLYLSTSGPGMAKKLAGTSALVFGTQQDSLLELAQELLTAEDSGDADGG